MATIVLGVKGSATSGNKLHAGRPGKVGGSMPRNFGQAQIAWQNMLNDPYFASDPLIQSIDITQLNRVGLQLIIDYDNGASQGAYANTASPWNTLSTGLQDPNNFKHGQMAPINPNAPSSAIHHPIQTAKLTGQQIAQQQPGTTHDPANQDVDWIDAGLAKANTNKPGQLYVLESNKWVLTVDKTDKTGKQGIADFKAGKITEEQLHEAVAPAYKGRKYGDADPKATDTQVARDGKAAFHDVYGEYVDGKKSRTEMTGALADQKWVTQVHLGDLNDNQWEKFSQFKRGLITESELRQNVAPHTLVVSKPPKVAKAPKVVPGDNPTQPAKYTKPEDLPSYDKIRNGGRYGTFGNGGDGILDNITHDQGFDGLPHLISRAEFKSYVAAGEVPVYRGTSSSSSNRSQRYKDFREGTLFNGYGMYGNGTYTSTSQKTARQYDGGESPSSRIMAMTVKKDAKIITHEDAEDLAIADNAKGIDYNIHSDIGRCAAAHGYDAILVKNQTYNQPVGKKEDFYVILNRTALRVVVDDFTPKDDTERYY